MEAEAEEVKMVEEQGEKGVVAAEAEKGKMVAEQEEKGVAALEEEEGKTVAEQGEKAVVTPEAEKGRTVEGQGEKSAVASEAEKRKTVEGQGEKAVATSEAEKRKMVEGQGEKAVAASEAEKGAAEAKDDVTTGGGGRFLTLESSDGEVHCVSEAAAQLSNLLHGMVLDGFTGKDVIPLPNVDGSTLVTVFEYCNKHAEADTKPDSDPNPTAGSSTSAGAVSAAASEDLGAWDRDFVDRLTTDALYDLFLASTYLRIDGLLDAVANKVADMIKGKTTDQIRDAFNIVNDLTPAQEAEAAELIRKYVLDFE